MCPCFTGIARIASLMGDNIEKGDIETWKPQRYRTWQALDLENRFFVRQNSEGDAEGIKIPSNIDPDGILSALAGDQWVYTDENQVSYYRMTLGPDGKERYTSNNPSEFKIGDIVEAQLSTLAVKRRGPGNNYSFKMVLRALTLLDGSHSKAARTLRMQEGTQHKPNAGRGIKRTVGYLEAEDDLDNSVPTAKMTKLTVSDDAPISVGSQSAMETS
ncbi:hypothetical protein HWV62_19275 [Athelia sp. TMB]|nr:hypothetical protein HWV62_19275 [Athelia sp. TMB]